MGVPKTTVATGSIPATGAEIVSWLTSHSVLAEIVDGLVELTPLGETTGPGARLRAVMHVGPSTTESEVVLGDVVAGRRVVWESADDQSRSLTFEVSEERGETVVSLTVSYELGEGLIGRLSAPLVAEAISSRAERSLENLRRLAEKREEER